ncbi:MAG TPA: pitrilysin family protein [Casimicrobiaceae bacterium]|nr:pitrilysin family protein [Casimicrobiaceae bacterium]
MLRSALRFLALAAFAPALALAQLPPGVKAGPSVEGVSQYTLANGLEVLLFPDDTKPTTTVNITYKVGSRHENYGETGMAHLLEHLMFLGSPSVDNLTKEFGRRGMNVNATTFYDRTNYFESFPVSDESLAFALKIEAERMTQAFIAKSSLDTEMTVVRNEFESGENSPLRVLWQKMQATAFEWHNYGKSTIGARSDIENVDIGRLQAFYRTYYQPDNAVLTVAGKFDPAKALALIATEFGRIPKPARTLPRLYTIEPPGDGERTVTIRRVGSAKYVGAMFRVMQGAHPDYAAMEALGEIMTVEPAGRLYQALVETRKATSVQNWSFATHDPGPSIFFAQVALSEPVEPARDALLATLYGVRDRPITAEELDRVRTKYLKDFDQTVNDPQAFGVQLSEWIALGDWRLFFLHRDRWRKLTPADVTRVATEWLKPANLTLGTFVPDAKPDRAPAYAAVDVDALVADYKGDAAVAAGEAFDPSPANLEARTQRVKLANGMTLAMLPKKTRGEIVRFSLRLRFGTEQSLKGTAPAGSLTGSMLALGTRERSRQAFDDALDALRAKVGFGGSSTQASASGETVRANVGGTLKLVAEAMKTPAFDAGEFDKLVRASLAQVEKSRTDPQAIAGRALTRHLKPYPAGDVRETPTFEEQAARLRAAKVDDLKAFHAKYYGASDAELAVVGDFDPAEVRALAEQLFGGWKSPSPYARVPDPYVAPRPAAETIETPDKPNAVLVGGTTLPMSDRSADYAAMLVAERILGGASESRMFEVIRTKLGLSYGVGTWLDEGRLDDNSTLGLYAIYAPQNLAKVRAAVDEQLRLALDKGFTAEEVDNAKRALLEERRTTRAQDSAVASSLAAQAYLGRTWAFSADIDRAIGAVGVEQANAALRKYLKPADLATFLVGDFAKK